MIYGLYGLAHISLSDFNDLCKQEGINYAIVTPTATVRKTFSEEKQKLLVVVVVGVATFLRMKDMFKKKKVCVFVIDNPIQLASIEASILGCLTVRSYHYRFYPIKSKDIEAAVRACDVTKPLAVKIRKTRVIQDMLRIASADTHLSGLQTLLYKIPVDERVDIQSIVFKWLAGASSWKKVSSVVKRLSSQTVANKLKVTLESPDLIRLRLACKHYLAKKGGQPDAISKKFKVSMYDLKYISKKAAKREGITLKG